MDRESGADVDTDTDADVAEGPVGLAPLEAPEAVAEPVARAARGGRAAGSGVAFLLAAAAILAALITARASLLGGQATGLWQQSVREEERRGALLIQGVRFTYGDEGDIAFLIATSQTRADALEEAAASAAPDIAERLRAEAQVHAQVAEAMRTSVVIGNDPQFVLPSGGYDLAASLARDRAEEGDDLLADDPVATVKAGDEASRHAIAILTITIVAGFAFLAGALAQALPSRRRLLLVAGWVVLGVAALLALTVELTA
jgi:hypothetical protein